MGKTCVVPLDLVINAEGKYEYILCGKPASFIINGWYICVDCKSTYPKSWPSTLIEGVE